MPISTDNLANVVTNKLEHGYPIANQFLESLIEHRNYLYNIKMSELTGQTEINLYEDHQKMVMAENMQCVNAYQMGLTNEQKIIYQKYLKFHYNKPQMKKQLDNIMYFLMQETNPGHEGIMYLKDFDIHHLNLYPWYTYQYVTSALRVEDKLLTILKP